MICLSAVDKKQEKLSGCFTLLPAQNAFTEAKIVRNLIFLRPFEDEVPAGKREKMLQVGVFCSPIQKTQILQFVQFTLGAGSARLIGASEIPCILWGARRGGGGR